MKAPVKTAYLFCSFVALACQEKVTPTVSPVQTTVKPVAISQSEPAKTPAPVAQGAAVPNPQPASTPTSQKAFVDPLPGWKDFLTDQLGGAPELSLVGDFNGDGSTDVATRVEDNLYFFHDVSGSEPKTWEHSYASENAPLTVKDAAWAIEQIPELKGRISEKQSVVALGEKAPLVYFWYAPEKSYAWLQVIPAELSEAKKDAVENHHASFGITKNNLEGESGFYGEPTLAQGFAGDFDNNNTLDLVVVNNDSALEKNVFFYANGAKKPTLHSAGYSGDKMYLVRSNKPTKLDSPFEEKGPTKIKGDYIYLELPEKSSAAIYYGKKGWMLYWLGD